MATLNERFTEANKEYELIKAQKDALEKDERALSSKQLETEKNVAIYRARRQELAYRLEELKKSIETNQKRILDVSDRKTGLESQINALLATISDQEQAVARLELDIEKQGSDKTQLAKSLDEINRQFKQLEPGKELDS